MHDVFLNEAEVNAPPKTEVEARRILLAATQECIERRGLSKVDLSDVASVAGVTRQTI